MMLLRQFNNRVALSSCNRPLFGSSPQERQAQKELIERFENKVTEALKNPDYQKGYDTLNLDNIAGYTPNMGPKTIAKLIADSDFTAEQIGSLMRQRERINLDTVQRLSEGFMKEMKSAGGTARPMPQTLYLALTHIFSPGECAGLSTAMAMAIMDGSENTLLDNLVIAAARPNLAENAAFLESITKLENSMMHQPKFHADSGALVPVDGIIKKMSKATSTTAWLLSSDEHAMVAGVRIDPTNISKKIWYFYEPSYGLAKFESEKAMKAGVNKLLKNGPIGTSQVHFGTPSKPLYGMSVFNQNNLAKQNWSIADVKKLSQPIGS